MDLKCIFSLAILVSQISLLSTQNVNVVIQGATSIAETDDNFDLKKKGLINAIKSFNPLRIQVGGSLQDQVVYGVGGVKNCPNFMKNEDSLFGFSQGCLPIERWDELNKFFNQTGVKVTFGLNALLGRNQSQIEKGLWVGDWKLQNARDFMKYTISRGYKVDSYEFGNQLSEAGMGESIEAEQYGKDIVVFKNLVKELHPDPKTQLKVLGPSGYYDEKWFNSFLEVSGHEVVDGVTHHIYNLGPGDDPNMITKIQDPTYLNQVAQTYKGILINWEWLQPIITRSSAVCFVSSALLWHRLMGSTVLAVTQESNPNLHVYAHCGKKKPRISVILINLSKDSSFNVTLSNYEHQSRNLRSTDGAKPNLEFRGSQNREEYHLAALAGNIQDPGRAINSFIDISTVHSCSWKLDDEGNWACKFDRQYSIAQALTVPPIAPQSSNAPKTPHEAYPAVLVPPTPHTACLLEAINGSLQVNERFNALTAHFDDHYNQLDEGINELAFRFPPPSDD
ncbi:hypothetical protein GOBAR_AA11232 [Gossypium barbadense]|uniref:Heparanase-like protein 2 n=1 Tax=Gossypium barbadense TaxID=3634 RepID=A0A2P5Y1C8_GOSBA|nr:hypothetical protein GOBAR_AA11232 [Gossypium barbadense]